MQTSKHRCEIILYWSNFEVGLNMKAIEGTDRLLAQKPGGMCQ
jgi:hypothetical protein